MDILNEQLHRECGLSHSRTCEDAIQPTVGVVLGENFVDKELHQFLFRGTRYRLVGLIEVVRRRSLTLSRHIAVLTLWRKVVAITVFKAVLDIFFAPLSRPAQKGKDGITLLPYPHRCAPYCPYNGKED